MYTNYFELNEKPFNLTPDPRFLYLSENHKEALAHLIYAVRERKGFIVLSGDVGTGKTTLLNTLLSRIDSTIQRAYIVNPNLDIKEFYQFLSHTFNLSFNGSKTEFLLQFEAFLKSCLREGSNVLLLIDEAQNLKPALLEEIRLLSNMETPQFKLIQIFLVGQEELHRKLNFDSLRQLRQRISVRYHITPLNDKDTEEYIKHRLKIAGSNSQKLFPPKAIKLIYKYSSGIPRIINILCDNTLVIAYARDSKTIDENLVKEAAHDLNLDVKANKSVYKISEPQHTKIKDKESNLKPIYFSLLLIFCSISIMLFYKDVWDLQFFKKVLIHNSIFASSIGTIHSNSFKNYPTIVSKMTKTLLHQEIKNVDISKKAENIEQYKSDEKKETTKQPDNKLQSVATVENSQQDRNNEKKEATKQPDNKLQSVATVENSQQDRNNEKKEAIEGQENKSLDRFVIAKSGDTVGKLALEQYGILNDNILKIVHKNNPEINNLNFILIGQIIRFPILTSYNAAAIKNQGLYGVHVSSSLDFQHAIDEQKKWVSMGYEAHLVPVVFQGKGKWYRIMLGAFTDKSESNALAKDILLHNNSTYAEVIPFNYTKITIIESQSVIRPESQINRDN